MNDRRPKPCITNGCTNGTRNEDRRCAHCRRTMREINEQIHAEDDT